MTVATTEEDLDVLGTTNLEKVFLVTMRRTLSVTAN